MNHISEITSAEAILIPFPNPIGHKIYVNAIGSVNTSGWSGARLLPRFKALPPLDGIWELDFLGDPPSGIVLEIILPVMANNTLSAPDWIKGIKIIAEKNSLVINIDGSKSTINAPLAYPDRDRFSKSNKSLIRQSIASYDDSFNPIGLCGAFSVKMKKLRHELTLVVEGPNENKIQSCIQNSIALGLVAAIVAVYATGGGGFAAATSVFLSKLEECLGDQFVATIEDNSYWIEWCT